MAAPCSEQGFDVPVTTMLECSARQSSAGILARPGVVKAKAKSLKAKAEAKAKSHKAEAKAKSHKAKAKARSLKAKTKAKAKARDQG